MKKKFYWPPLLIVFLTCCLSAITIAAGETSDMEGYLLDYSNATQLDLRIFMLQATKEPIFSWFTYFISYLTHGESPLVYKFILTSISLILLGTGIYNLSRVYIRHVPAIIITTSIMVFPVLLEGSAHLVRQMWSLGICLLIIRYGSIFLLPIAAGIHLVSLICAPLLFNIRKTMYISCLLILFLIFKSNLIDNESPIVQLTYVRLFGLLSSIGDTQLSGLSAFSFFILLTTVILSYLHQKKYLNAQEIDQLRVSRRIYLFTITHFVIIITSSILDYREMAERLIYNLYPIFLLLLGLRMERKGEIVFLQYGASIITLFIALYSIRNL